MTIEELYENLKKNKYKFYITLKSNQEKKGPFIAKQISISVNPLNCKLIKIVVDDNIVDSIFSPNVFLISLEEKKLNIIENEGNISVFTETFEIEFII